MGFDDSQKEDFYKNRSWLVNFNPIATISEKELKTIKKEVLDPEFYNLQVKQLIELIQISQPKAVVLLGKGLWEEIIEEIFEQTNSWQAD